MIQNIGLILQLLKYAPDVIKTIHSIIKAIEDTQKATQGKKPEEKKTHCKKILENKNILEVDYKNLDGMIDFGKEILKKNKVL